MFLLIVKYLSKTNGGNAVMHSVLGSKKLSSNPLKSPELRRKQGYKQKEGKAIYPQVKGPA